MSQPSRNYFGLSSFVNNPALFYPQYPRFKTKYKDPRSTSTQYASGYPSIGYNSNTE